MLSRRSETSRVALFVTDQVFLAGAFFGAVALQGLISGLGVSTALRGHLGLYLVTAPVLAVLFNVAGLYRLPLETAEVGLTRLWTMLWGGLFAMVALQISTFIAAQLGLAELAGPLHRGTGFLFSAFTTVGLWASRSMVGVAGRRLVGEGDAGARVLVIGHSPRVLRLLASFQRAPHLGLNVIGVVSPNDLADVAPPLTMEAALEMIEQSRIDHVIIETANLDGDILDQVMTLADREGVSVHITSPIFPQTNLLPTWERVGGVPVLGFVAAELPLGARAAKRGFDLVVATTLLILLALPMAVLGLLVRLTSKGPAFFVQDRIGKGGHPFPMFKFRSMLSGAETGTGPVWATPDDPRNTGFGRWLRRNNFDELPQLINVIMGHMSLVGPRPERPEFVQGFKRKIPRYAHKHWVKPGITGWAQVHGLRGNTPLTDRVEHDLYYIENWSLLLDVRILVRTVFHEYLKAA